MIRGLFFSEDGSVQELGNVNNWGLIIQYMEQALPKLKELQHAMLTSQLSVEQLETLLAQKKQPNTDNQTIED